MTTMDGFDGETSLHYAYILPVKLGKKEIATIPILTDALGFAPSLT